MYRGEDVGFGGYVYGVPGIYGRTVVFDVQSMHPSTIRALNLFGDEYTKRFGDIVDLRIAIKHKDYDKAKTMLDGKVAKYLDDPATAKQLSQALKISINAVYGQTSATYDNCIFKDPRNVNNIVALRGALFMVNLRDEILKRGYKVISIKTDSVKVVNADKDISDFIFSYGKEYGYNFEIENIFERICLVNNSTFIAKCAEDDPETPGKWVSKATQFQVPYVFKTLFSREELTFNDYCEVKAVSQGEIYIDMNEGLPENEHHYIFVGKVGQFTPIKEGCGGGILYRRKDGKDYAVAGTLKSDKAKTPYRWMESTMVQELHREDDIDISYYERLCDDAIAAIEKYGSFENFISDDFEPEPFSDFMNVPTGEPDEVPFEGSHIVEQK